MLCSNYIGFVFYCSRLLSRILVFKTKNTIIYFRWLTKVLTRLHHPIRVYLNRLLQTDNQMDVKRKSAEAKAEVIQQECSSFFKKFSDMYVDATESLSSPLLEYIKGPQALADVKTWRRDDLPAEVAGDSWPIIKLKIEEAINDRICEVLRSWEMENHFLQARQQELLNFIGINSSSIASEIRDLEKFIRCTSAPMKITRLSRSLSEFQAEQTNTQFFSELKTMSTVILGVVNQKQNVAVQNIVDSLFLTPTVFMDFKEKRQQQLVDRNHEEYKRDKVSYVSNKAVSTLQSLQNEKTARHLVNVQLDGLSSYVKEIVDNTPKLLRANQELLKDKRDQAAMTGTYATLGGRTKQLLERSAKFSIMAIREYEMTWADVASRGEVFGGSDVTHMMSHLNPVKGLFAFYEAGQLKDNQKVTLKSYYSRMKSSQAIEEEDTIRYGCIIIVRSSYFILQWNSLISCGCIGAFCFAIC